MAITTDAREAKSISDVGGRHKCLGHLYKDVEIRCLGHLYKDVEIRYEVLTLRSIRYLFGLSTSCLSYS